jgi:hypothetical protein
MLVAHSSCYPDLEYGIWIAATNQIAAATTNLDSRWQCSASSLIVIDL